MEKKFMNKLDDMELDMVAGGKITPPPEGFAKDEDNSPLYQLGRKMNNAVVNGGKAVVNGAKSVVGVFERFFRMARRPNC